MTFNELASAVVIFHEILSNSRKDISLKPDEKPPHYRRFRVNQVLPLQADNKTYQLEWTLLKKAKESVSGKPINPVLSGKKFPNINSILLTQSKYLST